MQMTRRGSLVAAIAALLAEPALGQSVQKPLRLVVPYPPGGGADLLARAFATRVGQRTGRVVVVENRGGATGIIGSTAVARATPDGDTILQGDSATMVVQPSARQLPYGVDDFAPIARLTTNPVMLVANTAGPFRGIADVVARAKAAPGSVSVGTSGVLSHYHVVLERMNQMARIELLHIPFQGTPPGVIAVMSGQVDLVIVPPAPLADPGIGDRLRAIGVMSADRLPDFPDVPTFREAGLDLVSLSWRGLLAPKATPAVVLSVIEGWVMEAFADPAFARQIASIGETPAPLDRAGFAAFLNAERAAMRDVLQRVAPN